MSRIIDATFKASQHDIQQGRVTVFYNNSREDEFDGVDRGQFYQWAERHFDVFSPPTGVRVAASAIDDANAALNAVDDDYKSPEEIAAAELQAHRANRARIEKINAGYSYNQSLKRWETLEEKKAREQQHIEFIQDLGFKIEDV